jgi:hypothetical protein
MQKPVFTTKDQVAAHRVARFLSYTLNRSFKVEQNGCFQVKSNRMDLPQKEHNAMTGLAKAFLEMREAAEGGHACELNGSPP